MKNQIYFTLRPSPAYFTFPFHLRQSLKTVNFSGILQPSRLAIPARDFFNGLIRLLNIPDDYCGIVFHSDFEFKSFLGDAFYHSRSRIFQPTHREDEFASLLNSRGYHPQVFPIDIHEPVLKIKTGRANLPAYTLRNDPHTGSSIPAGAVSGYISDHPDSFFHADLTSLIPGSPVSFGELPSYSFSLNTSFGIPNGEVVWFISPGFLNKYLIKQEGPPPADHLVKLSDQYYSYEFPDLLFLDVARRVTGDFIAKGLKNIIQETRYKFAVIEQAVKANPVFEFTVKEPANRSLTTLVLQYRGVTGQIADEFSKSGFVVDKLVPEGNAQRIRITNFPVHSKEQFELLADRIALMN